jgi:hypothetical protein
MKKNQTNFGNQQSDSKLNKQPTQNSPVSSQEKSSTKVEVVEEYEVKTTIQRKPQFRLNENMKRRFH